MQFSYFDTLPNEIIVDIGLRLNIKDVLSYCGVSKLFNNVICNDNYFWEEKLYQDFGINNSSNDPKCQYTDMFDDFNLSTSSGLAAGIGNMDILRYIIYLASIRGVRLDLCTAMKSAIYNNREIYTIISLGFDNWNEGLRYSAESRNLQLVEFFISKGATDMEGGLNAAVESDCKELIQFFICKGAKDWNSAMRMAAENCHVHLVHDFISKGANDWNCGLNHSCMAKEETCALQLVKYFISRGARDLKSAIYTASLKGYETVVAYLISKGARDWHWGLQGAAVGNCLKLVKYFIGRGANNLKLAFINGCKSGNAEIVKFLLQSGVSMDDDYLLGPSIDGHIDVVEVLIEALKYTPNFNRTINVALTVVMRERGNKYKQIRKILLKNGAIED